MSDKMSVHDKHKIVKLSMKKQWADAMDENIRYVNNKIASQVSLDDVNFCPSLPIEGQEDIMDLIVSGILQNL